MAECTRNFPISMPDVSPIASLFADQTRAAICGALMSGTAWTAGELAAFAHVSRPTASEHITKLVEAGILREHRQGRHRYLMISSAEVAELIETLAQASKATLHSPQSLNANRVNREFVHGRTCYNHLAGELGVCLLQQLIANDYLDNDFQLSDKGVELLERWGIKNPHSLKGKPCMDTTQRVFHLAGSLGSALCQHFFEFGWMVRDETTRCVCLTEEGDKALSHAGINLK